MYQATVLMHKRFFTKWQNGTLHNGTLENSTFQKGKPLQNCTWLKMIRDETVRVQKMLHVTKRYTVTKWYVQTVHYHNGKVS